MRDVAHNLTAHQRALSDAKEQTVIFIDPSYEPLTIGVEPRADVNRVPNAAYNIYDERNRYQSFGTSAVVEMEKRSSHFTIIKVTDPVTFGDGTDNNIWIVYRTENFASGLVRPFFAMKNLIDLTEVKWENDVKDSEPTVAFLAIYKDRKDNIVKATLVATCLIHGEEERLKKSTVSVDNGTSRSFREIDLVRQTLHMLEEIQCGAVEQCSTQVSGKTTTVIREEREQFRLPVFDKKLHLARVDLQCTQRRLVVEIICLTDWHATVPGDGEGKIKGDRYRQNAPAAGGSVALLLLSVNISAAGCISTQEATEMKRLSYRELEAKIAQSAGLAQISLLLEQKVEMDNRVLAADGSLGKTLTKTLLRWTEGTTDFYELFTSEDDSKAADPTMLQTIFILVAAFAVTMYHKLKSRCNMFIRQDMDDDVARVFNSVRADPILIGLLNQAGIRDTAAPSLLHSIVCKAMRADDNNVFQASDLFPSLLGIDQLVMIPRNVKKLERNMSAIKYAVDMLQKNLYSRKTFDNQLDSHKKLNENATHANLHYFVSAGAAEIERLAGVAATREAEAVPLLGDPKAAEVVDELYAVNDPDASLTRPNDKDRSYIHPNVTFFNVGVLQAVCDLARRGARIEVCPAVYAEYPDVDKYMKDGGFLMWPVTPSVRVTVAGSNFVVKSGFIRLSIPNCIEALQTDTSGLPQQEMTDMTLGAALQLTSDRVLKRATMVQSLPAVALLDVQGDMSVDFRRSTTSASMHCVIVRNMQLNPPRFAVFCKVVNDQWIVWRVGHPLSDDRSSQEMCPLKYVSGDEHASLVPTIKQTLQTNLAAHDIASATHYTLGLDYNDPSAKYDAAFWLDRTSLFAYNLDGKASESARDYAQTCFLKGTIYGMPKTA